MTHRNASADILNLPQGEIGSARRSAAEWIALMRARLDPPTAASEQEEERTGPDPQQAAVLAPLVLNDDRLHVILTVRPLTLPRHAGQICFPGGRIHAEDKDAAFAALRETEEEIGLSPDHIELLGSWDTFDTIGGFRVRPFAGLVDPVATPRADPGEVAEMFTAPFDFLMDPANYSRESLQGPAGVRYFTAIRFGDYYIWGATAGMLRALSERLRA
jgi:8-oxo-dGTP pyrophosphatase MutT (NUDIX family)